MRSLERQPLTGDARLILVLELADRPGGRGDRGRGDCLQERVGYGLVQAGAAERPAGVAGVMHDVPDRAQVPRDVAAVARIGDLHSPAAAPAANQALQQRVALSGSAASLPAGSHVRRQLRSRGEVLIPGDIAGMVLGQADGPLLDRQLDHLDPETTLSIKALLLARLAEHERSRIGGVDEEVVHRPIARARPPDPALPDRSPRQFLTLVDQLHHDLAG